MANPKTITLNVPYLFQKEAPLIDGTSGPVTPGMLVEFVGGKVQPCSVDGKAESILVAVETPFRPDSGNSSGIDTAYDEDDEAVAYIVAHSGDQLYMFLAAGEDVDSLDDRLASNEDGTLKVGAGQFRPLELKDNDPGTDDAAVRIRVEVL